MLKIFATLFTVLMAMPAFAAPSLSEVLIKAQFENLKVSRAIDWKPGDTASYNLDMGFIQGTMVTAVRSNDGNEIWLTQDMDLGFAGKQQTETLMDANTGEIKKILMNGQEQQIPEQNLEVIEIVDATITVPAGTFDCMHARLTDKSTNDEINIWANATVPMSGMVKQIVPSQLGEVTVELTSFLKQ